MDALDQLKQEIENVKTDIYRTFLPIVIAIATVTLTVWMLLVWSSR